MCMPSLGKIAPYAVGGLLGGTLLKSMFGSSDNNKKQSAVAPPVQTSQGVVGAPPTGY